MNDFETAWAAYRQRVERALAAHLPEATADSDCAQQRLHQAMRYACLNGGKRFRAMLVYACGQVAGASLAQLDPPAVAIEMVHAYSLVHDDLPCMDDDDLRRGKPTCHIAFDEATAVLVGDALQSRGFEILAQDDAAGESISLERRLRMLASLAAAIGAAGMAGGQALDMGATGAATGLEIADLQRIHARKTGALMGCAAALGGLAATNASDALVEKLEHYGRDLGLGFQIVDDILDVAAQGEALGKRGGGDARNRKATYVSRLGLAQARAEAQRVVDAARAHIADLGDKAQFLNQLADFVLQRSF